MTGINLDALLGEQDDRPLTYKGQDFTLPAELPADVLAPFLSDDIGLIDLFSEVLSEAGDDDDILEMVLAALKKRRSLPKELVAAIRESFRLLLGADYDRFIGTRPSLRAFTALAAELGRVYGVGLTDFFDSPESLETGGTTSKETYPTTTPESTPEESGDAPVAPATSD